jgi:hypothetical protein
MKKIILAIAALALIASPAMAVDWNFYGSARMATFYITNGDNDSEVNPYNVEGSKSIGEDDDGVQWQLQGNSRLGANVKAENVSGRVELALTSQNTHDGSVSTRLLYGDWDFGAAKLRVGKAYTPTSQFISGQVFAADLGLLGVGTSYGRRVPGLQLMFGGFTVALLEPNQEDGDGWGTFTDAGGDPDSYLPKIEAGWGMSMDTWNFNLMGGYQYVELEETGPDEEDIDVSSWVIGGDIGFNFGPAYVKGAVSYGENWTNARWSDLAIVDDVAAAGQFDGDDDVDDSENLQGSVVAGFKFTDTMTFEGGCGYRSADSDAEGFDEDEAWNCYLQSVIGLAPGVWLIPEAGYFNFEDGPDGEDQDEKWYLGAKWQIDF